MKTSVGRRPSRRGEHDLAAAVDDRAHRAERVEVRVEAPAADHVAARRRHDGAVEAREQRARRAGTRRGSARRARGRSRPRARSAAHSATSLGPRQLDLDADRAAGSRASPRRRGCAARCARATSSSVRTHEARIGSAPFLFPAGTIVPESGTPPSMTNFSMSLRRRARGHDAGRSRRRSESVTAICQRQVRAGRPGTCMTAPTRSGAPRVLHGARRCNSVAGSGRRIGSVEPIPATASDTYTCSHIFRPTALPTVTNTCSLTANIAACPADARRAAPGPLVPPARGRRTTSTGRSTGTSTHRPVHPHRAPLRRRSGRRPGAPAPARHECISPTFYGQPAAHGGNARAERREHLPARRGRQPARTETRASCRRHARPAGSDCRRGGGGGVR